ncbi:MAG: hypothetical protein R3344_16015 [Acidobacteriota bacterium]|nr:hypothetical protein [Acidobacteriota bacterium]
MRFLRLAMIVMIFSGTACAVSVNTRPTPPPPVEVESTPVHPAHLGIPPGHLPPPGGCRVWIPGRPPGHQPPSGDCERLAHEVPPGAWLVYRPSKDRRHVHVSVYDRRRPNVVVVVRVYEAQGGRFVREDPIR